MEGQGGDAEGTQGAMWDLAQSATLAHTFEEQHNRLRGEVEDMQNSLEQPHMHQPAHPGPPPPNPASLQPQSASDSQGLQHFIDGLCSKLTHRSNSDQPASQDLLDETLPPATSEPRPSSELHNDHPSPHQEQERPPATSDDHLSQSGFDDISRMLRESGFEGLQSSSDSELKHKLSHVLQHSRKKQEAIDRARSEASEERSRASRLAKEADRLESERLKLEREAGKKELQRESAAEASGNELSKAKEEARRAKQAESSAQQQISQLQHQLKAKENEAQQVRDKLQAKVDAEDRRASRDRDALQQMQQSLLAEKRSGSPKHAASGFSPGEIVSAYESMRERLEGEMQDLRLENEQLRQQYGVDEKSAAEQAEHENGEPESVASGTYKMYSASEPDKRQSHGGERKRSLRTAPSQQSPLSSRTQMKRDKKDHRLQLHLLESLSHATLVEHLRSACRCLDLSDPAKIGESISKLQKLAGMVPRLEAFVANVSSAASNATGDEVQPCSVPETVRSLADRAAKADELERFKLIASRQLRKCSTPAVRERCTNEEAACAIADLVQIEREHAQAKDTLSMAERALQSEHGDMANELVKHFMDLFGVQSLEGVVPEMNRMHVHMSEATNFLATLRQMLGLENNASTEQVTSRLRQLLPGGKSLNQGSMLLSDYKDDLKDRSGKVE